jgi:anti-sigma factor ChrR (cupin superfamily)
MTALDATAREVDERLPAAFAALDERTAASRALIDQATPEITRMGTEAAATLDRLIDAEALLAKQRAALDAGNDAAARFVATVEDADAKTRALADGTGATLVEALVRVRETANQAAERAREAIEAVIPASAERLSNASRDALTRAITEQVEVQIASLAATAEGALDTAHKASDRLMRQMLTIADTSASVEARIAEARADAETADRDNFARRVALLIESLNSTAIDVTKILSNEVTDSAWASYLKGDRGVFTRRAVRLIDNSEAREIVQHYENEPEFREQVNRYIHDFESMLRRILADRDSSALGVTVLSSDMGKLYVALAQAIERLR